MTFRVIPFNNYSQEDRFNITKAVEMKLAYESMRYNINGAAKFLESWNVVSNLTDPEIAAAKFKHIKQKLLEKYILIRDIQVEKFILGSDIRPIDIKLNVKDLVNTDKYVKTGWKLPKEDIKAGDWTNIIDYPVNRDQVIVFYGFIQVLSDNPDFISAIRFRTSYRTIALWNNLESCVSFQKKTEIIFADKTTTEKYKSLIQNQILELENWIERRKNQIKDLEASLLQAHSCIMCKKQLNFSDFMIPDFPSILVEKKEEEEEEEETEQVEENTENDTITPEKTEKEEFHTLENERFGNYDKIQGGLVDNFIVYTPTEPIQIDFLFHNQPKEDIEIILLGTVVEPLTDNINPRLN